MDDNKKSIFRKQSLERVSSPEELDNYLVVTRPGIWFTLIAIIVLLAGVFVWSVLGRLTVKMNVAVISSQDMVFCYIPLDKVGSLAENCCVTIAGEEYSLKDIGYSTQVITSDTDINICIAGSLMEGTFVKPMAVKATLPEGIYAGEIIVESIKPISYILN